MAEGGSAQADPNVRELLLEREALDEIRRVHRAHIARARASAERLATEAAEMSEEGIRDLVDEDAEVDAAVRAALVRQTSARAMHGFRRLQQLEEMGDALAFGHTTSDDGAKLRVGRHSVIDGDRALVVDWRARAAMAFYRATPLERLGVRQRRHLFFGDGVDGPVDEIISFSDEVFDVADLSTATGLRGEAAILASVAAPTESQMRSVVATIQAEQDAVIRAPSDGALVVQGGPGTGKTVVALHRAAYLLYDKRVELSDSGVLIVGPTKEFLRYIANVLPSLGESGVVSVTVAELYPGVRRGRPEAPDVAQLKGRACMASLLANAVADRQRLPVDPLVVRYGATRASISAEELGSFFTGAKSYSTHNEGANAFRAVVIDALCTVVDDPTFGNREDAVATFSRSREVRQFLLKHWPTLTPEQLVNDLFGSPSLLHLAARNTGLSSTDLRLLSQLRVPEADLANHRWSEADLALLDEALDLVGGLVAKTEEQRILERDAADEFELSERSDEVGSLIDQFQLVPELDFDPDDPNDDPNLRTVNASDPMAQEMGSDGSEYGAIDRPAYEDDRYGYG